MNTLFTMTGRFSRKQYIVWSLAVGVVSYTLAFALGFALGMGGAGETGTTTVTFLITLAGSIIQAFIVVRRLHDLNKPGVHFWLLLVPLYNVYLALVLLFQKGTTGPNQFGQDPATA